MQAAEGNRRCGTCRCSGCIWNRADEAWKSGCLEAAVKYNRLLKLEEKLGKSLGTDCP